MSFTDRVASLHPAVVTIVFLALFIGGAIGMNMLPLGSATWALAYSVSMILLTAPVMLWHFSIYRAASERSAAFVGHRGRRAFLFVLSAAGMVLFLTTFPIWMRTPVTDPSYQTLLTLNSISMIVSCLSYFAAIWAAANALTRHDEQKRKVGLHKTLGTFLLELYFPVGVWFIYQRIRKATDSPLPG